MNKIEINTSLGIFELVKPKAGIRNRALIKAETKSGHVSRIIFMTELLPQIVNKRPESCDKDVPIEHLLNSLEVEDYDELIEGVDKLLGTTAAEADIDKKKE